MKTTDTDFPAALRRAAEGWEGTPFRSLTARRGIGVDCANVVVACLLDAGIALPDLGAPSFGKSADVSYVSVIEDFLANLVKAGIIAPLDDVAAPQILPGDLCLYRISRRTQHLALAVDAESQIHAWPGRPCMILTFDQMWQRLLKAHYRLTNNG